jgi:hypothetical protein
MAGVTHKLSFFHKDSDEVTNVVIGITTESVIRNNRSGYYLCSPWDADGEGRE